MVKNLIEQFKNMEISIKRVLHCGFIFSFFVAIISMFILFTYHVTTNFTLYYIGLNILRLSLFFAIEFVVCAIAIDTIKKQVT